MFNRIKKCCIQWQWLINGCCAKSVILHGYKHTRVLQRPKAYS